MLPRSTEIQPLSLRFVPPNPHVACHTRMPQGLEVKTRGTRPCPSEEASGLAIKTPRGTDLHLVLVMFLDALLIDWPCAIGRPCVEFCGEVATRCLCPPKFCARTTLLRKDTRLCIYTQCVTLVASSKSELKTQRPPTFLRFCTLWSKNQ